MNKPKLLNKDIYIKKIYDALYKEISIMGNKLSIKDIKPTKKEKEIIDYYIKISGIVNKLVYYKYVGNNEFNNEDIETIKDVVNKQAEEQYKNDLLDFVNNI